MYEGCHRHSNEGLIQRLEMRKGERRHIIVVLLIFRCVRFFIKSQTGASHRFLKTKVLLERTQARLYHYGRKPPHFSQKPLPRCQRKGEGNFLNKIRLFLPQYLPSGCLPSSFRKANGLLDTLREYQNRY